MILGMETEIGGLTIRWDHRVLEPRPWTAAQSQWLAELAPTAPAGRALELCSGAGHIGLLLQRLTGRRLVMVDANPVACEFAGENARAAGVAEEELEIRHALMAEALRPDEHFPLILADPPWVPRAEISRYPDDPQLAIDGGEDGLAIALECLALIDRHLAPGGHAVLQLGTTAQADALVARQPPTRVGLVEVRDLGQGTLVHLAAASPTEAGGSVSTRSARSVVDSTPR